jgi:hypothetical protein
MSKRKMVMVCPIDPDCLWSWPDNGSASDAVGDHIHEAHAEVENDLRIAVKTGRLYKKSIYVKYRVEA